MTTINTEQERADFEMWWDGLPHSMKSLLTYEVATQAYELGRAALQSQVKNDRTLFCDLKTDEEKSAFFLSGRGYETGVIALSIQSDVAMAYHRCAEYKKELEALQSQDREDAARIEFLEKEWFYRNTKGVWAFGFSETWEAGQHDSLREAIDHARRVEGE